MSALDWIFTADPRVLPDPAVRLYLMLKATAGQGDTIQVSQDHLAVLLHRSTRSIHRALGSLYDLGLVELVAIRKITVTVPGQPVRVTMPLILKVLDAEPPSGHEGYSRLVDALGASPMEGDIE
jgi:hypothetical protein